MVAVTTIELKSKFQLYPNISSSLFFGLKKKLRSYHFYLVKKYFIIVNIIKL